MPVYADTKNSSAVTNAVFETIVPPAGQEASLLSAYLLNLQTTANSAGQRWQLRRTTGGSTPTAGSTEKLNQSSPAKQATVDVQWGTDPSLSGTDLVTLGYANTGGSSIPDMPRHWRAPEPRKPIIIGPSTQFTVTSTLNDQLQTTVTWIEPSGQANYPVRPIRGRRGRRRGYWFHSQQRRGTWASTSRPAIGYGSEEFRMLQTADWDIEQTPPFMAPAKDTGGGSQTFNVTVDAAQGETVTLLDTAQLIVTATQAQAASVLRSVTKLLTASQAQAVSLVRTALLQRTATQAQSVTVTTVKAVNVAATATQAQVVTLLRTAQLRATAAQGQAVSLLRTVSIIRTATQAQAASVQCTAALIVSAVQAQAATLKSVASLIVSAVQATAASVTATFSGGGPTTYHVTVTAVLGTVVSGGKDIILVGNRLAKRLTDFLYEKL